MNNHFQALGAIKGRASVHPGVYPTVPATWPNRGIRRGVRYGHALPTEWIAHFFKFPHLKTFIKTGVMA